MRRFCAYLAQIPRFLPSRSPNRHRSHSLRLARCHLKRKMLSLRPAAMTTEPGKNALTYKDAGVDIDRGDALVDRIAPFAKATRRPGADAALGGFGGLFDLKAAGFHDPILVAATDGVGTKLRIAIETRRFGGLGQDLVAMCVNDIVVQGAEPLFFLDYYASGKLEVEVAAAVVEGIARACRDTRLRADRRRDGRNAGPVCQKRFRSCGLRRGRRRASRYPAQDRPHAGGRRADRRCFLGRPFQRLFAGAPHRRRLRAFLRRAGAVCGRPIARRSAAHPHRALCRKRARRDPGRRRAWPRPHHRRRHHGEFAAGTARRPRRRNRSWRVDSASGLWLAGEIGRHRPGRDAAHLQLRHRACRHCSRGPGGRGDRRLCIRRTSMPLGSEHWPPAKANPKCVTGARCGCEFAPAHSRVDLGARQQFAGPHRCGGRPHLSGRYRAGAVQHRRCPGTGARAPRRNCNGDGLPSRVQSARGFRCRDG